MNEQTFSEDFFNILRILSTDDNHLTQRDLSSHLGISLGKTNYLLKAMVAKGLVKIKNFSYRDEKLKKIRYILTKKGFQRKVGLTRKFLQKKEKEFLQLKKELESIHTVGKVIT